MQRNALEPLSTALRGPYTATPAISSSAAASNTARLSSPFPVANISIV
jgi:hypothetical protein